MEDGKNDLLSFSNMYIYIKYYFRMDATGTQECATRTNMSETELAPSLDDNAIQWHKKRPISILGFFIRCEGEEAEAYVDSNRFVFLIIKKWLRRQALVVCECVYQRASLMVMKLIKLIRINTYMHDCVGEWVPVYLCRNEFRRMRRFPSPQLKHTHTHPISLISRLFERTTYGGLEERMCNATLLPCLHFAFVRRILHRSLLSFDLFFEWRCHHHCMYTPTYQANGFFFHFGSRWINDFWYRNACV